MIDKSIAISSNNAVNKRWAIIGAGNGGQAFAAYLSLQGIDITIYDVFQNTVDVLNKQGGVYLEGNCKQRGFGKILFASTNIERVMEGSEVILVILPSLYHKDIAEKMAPYLKDGQVIIINPITPLGPIEFRKALDDSGCTANITLAGSNTLLFACRLKEQGRVLVSGQKQDILVAAYPSTENAAVETAIKGVLAEFRLAPDILMVSLDNLNFEFHPGPTLLYTAMIENNIDYEYYSDFVPSQVKLVQAIDKERLKLCQIYHVKVRDVAKTFHDEYGYEGNLYQMIKNADVYKGIKGPSTLSSRFLTEDIPYSLCAIQTLAKIAKIATPAIDTVVNLAYILIGEDLGEGRTLANLGLNENTTVEDVLFMCRGL